MMNNLFQFSNNTQKVIDLIKLLNNSKNEVRFVGGIIRDNLLGFDNPDIDLATTYVPDELISVLNQNNIKYTPTGINHGTITVHYHDLDLEITTLRQDHLCDGRHAKVIFGLSWEEDSIRRDFTINALYADINGKIYDYHNGLQDLQNRIVRFIGEPEQRIKEDYLRILRFLRFSVCYAENIDQQSLRYCIKNAEGLRLISIERIKKELSLIFGLRSGSYISIIEALYKINLLSLFGIDSKKSDIEKKLNIFNALISVEREYNFTISYKAVYLLFFQSDILKEELFDFKTKLKFTNLEYKYIQNLYNSISYIQNNNDEDMIFNLKYLIYNNNYELIFEVVIIYSLLTNNKPIINEIIKIKNWQIKPLPISGQDIIKLGLDPGPKIKQYLNYAVKYWVRNEFNITKDDIIKYINMEYK